MQGVAKFVEQGAGVVKGQKAWLACGGFGEVADVHCDGADVFAKVLLAAETGAPRARAF